MIQDVLVIEGKPDTWEEALNLTFQELFNAGYVKETFLQGCVLRERVFPTGLMTEIPIAIPHTDAQHVNVPSICVLRLRKPVAFKDMGEPEKTVFVEYVFNMALKNNQDQLPMLEKILKVAKNGEFLRELKKMDLEDIQKDLSMLWTG